VEAFSEEDGEESNSLDDVVLLLIGHLLKEGEVEGTFIGLAQDLLHLTQLLLLFHLPSLEQLLHLLVQLFKLHLFLAQLLLTLTLGVILLTQNVLLDLLEFLWAIGGRKMLDPLVGATLDQVLEEGAETGEVLPDECVIDEVEQLEVLVSVEELDLVQGLSVRGGLEGEDIGHMIADSLIVVRFHAFLFFSEVFVDFSDVLDELDDGFKVVVVN
jgi:hypothetical protein